jgi:hypothetical protein
MGASTPALHQKNQDNDPRDQNEEHVKIPGRSGQRPLILPRRQPCLMILYSF